MIASAAGEVQVVDTLIQHGAAVDLKANVRAYQRVLLWSYNIIKTKVSICITL